MPTLKKLLSRFNKKDREILESLIKKIFSLDWRNLDIKKLRGHQDVFRLRKGDLRIIYQAVNKKVLILNIARRKEDTYKFWLEFRDNFFEYVGVICGQIREYFAVQSNIGFQEFIDEFTIGKAILSCGGIYFNLP